MKLSVLIACYNGETTLADQFEGLAAQEWSEPWEILFVDNRSTDGSLAIARQYQARLPNLRIIDASEKQGKAFALNKGVAQAAGESVAFADADDQVAPGWLAAVGEAMKHHELIATRCDVEVLNTEASRYRGTLQLDGLRRIHYPPYLLHAGGGTIAIRRDLHFRIGGFDESLPHLEDTDYVWKAQLKAGAEIHFVPEAVMRVRYRSTAKGTYRQARKYAEYNVFLSKRYRAYGDPMPRPWRRYVNGWKEVLRSAGSLRRPHLRVAWLGRLGWMVGRTIGIIKYRVPPV